MLSGKFRSGAVAVVFGLLLGLAACDDDDSSHPEHAHSSARGSDAGAAEGKDPVYVFLIQIPDSEGDLLSYVSLQNSPAFSEIKQDKLRMFAPYSGIAAVGGYVFHGDGEAPFVTKYRITDELGWEEVAKINFSNFPLPDGEAMNFYFANFKDEHTVYHHYGEDKSFRIQWDPIAAKIVKAHTDTHLPKPTAEKAVGASGNRTDVRWFKGPVMQPFHQVDLAKDNYGSESYIVVYDEETHEERELLTIQDCPGLEQVSKDEKGDLYFSSTYNVPLDALFSKGPAPCVVKVKADGTLDESFEKTDLRKYTGGHYAINLRYLTDGKAIAHVLHEERMKIDFKGDIDPKLWDEVYDDETLWELELIDFKAGTSKAFTGFKDGHDVGVYGRTLTLEGKTFFIYMTEEDDSVMYELHPDGTATYDSDVRGTIWSVDRLR